MKFLCSLQLLMGAVILTQTGDNIAGNRPSPKTITLSLSFFLILIFILIGVAIFVAFICYHAKDKKIDNLTKLIKEQPNDKELQLLTTYRKLDDKDKEAIEIVVKNISDSAKNSNNHNNE